MVNNSPLIISNKLKSLVKTVARSLLHKKYGYFGNYSSWTSASSDTVGYNSEIILNKVQKSASLAKHRKIAYERDGVTFKNVEYSWPTLAIFTSIFITAREFNIIDFGGSLGSSYYQYRDYLKKLFKNISWNIVEQPHYVRIGKAYFRNSELKFYNDVDECVKKHNSKVLYISGTLQYLEDPQEFIKNISEYQFEHIILDRTLFIQGKTRIAIQKVPPFIYKASYPVWMFNKQELIKSFSAKYTVEATYPSYCDAGGYIEGKEYYFSGIWFKRI